MFVRMLAICGQFSAMQPGFPGSEKRKNDQPAQIPPLQNTLTALAPAVPPLRTQRMPFDNGEK